MTRNNVVVKGLSVLLFMFALPSAVLAAPPGPCEGPNKNDPGCPGTEVLAVPVVDSVTVDWFNEKFVVRGNGLTAVSFLLGSNATPLGTANVTDTELDIPFNSDIADEVLTEGNYGLAVDGTVQLSVYIESQVVDPGASVCPCTSDWADELAGLWGPNNTDCLEVTGTGDNDIADISGTILSNSPDPTVYPYFPIGASFYPGDPDSSVCRLVQVNADASTVELVNMRINENQQEDCAAQLTLNVCTVP